MDYRGGLDSAGRRLEATTMAWADELAGAAEPVMGKTRGIPVAIVRGLTYPAAEGSARALIRHRSRISSGSKDSTRTSYWSSVRRRKQS